MSILEQLFPSEAPALAWPAGLPDHLSATSLNMWMRCREQWRRRYVLGEKERPAAALLWGSSHHFALLDVNFAQKITTGEDLTVDDVKLAFADDLDRRVEREGDELDWGKDSPGEVKDKGVAMVAAYHQLVSPSVQPVTVEEQFSLDVPGMPVPITGRIDATEPERTIDLKTGNKREVKPDNAFQARIYQLVKPVPMEFHLATKTKVPGIYTPAEYPEFGFAFGEAIQARTRMTLALLAADIASTYERFGPDETWPGAFAYGWACSYCGFKPTCAYWAGETPTFGDHAAGVTTRPEDALEAERLALTRTLLDIGDKRGTATLTRVVAAIDADMKSKPLAEHVAWLQAQLERATEVIA